MLHTFTVLKFYTNRVSSQAQFHAYQVCGLDKSSGVASINLVSLSPTPLLKKTYLSITFKYINLQPKVDISIHSGPALNSLSSFKIEAGMPCLFFFLGPPFCVSKMMRARDRIREVPGTHPSLTKHQGQATLSPHSATMLLSHGECNK